MPYVFNVLYMFAALKTAAWKNFFLIQFLLSSVYTRLNWSSVGLYHFVSLSSLVKSVWKEKFSGSTDRCEFCFWNQYEAQFESQQAYFWVWTNLAQTWKLIYADTNRHWNIEDISKSCMVLMDFFIYVSYGGKTDENCIWNISDNSISFVMVYWNTWKMQCYCLSNKMDEMK